MPVINLLPLGSKCALQSGKQQNLLKHFSFKVNTMLNFLRRGQWGDIAGGGGFLQFAAQARRVSSVGMRTSGSELPSSDEPGMRCFDLVAWPINFCRPLGPFWQALSSLPVTICVPKGHTPSSQSFFKEQALRTSCSYWHLDSRCV